MSVESAHWVRSLRFRLLAATLVGLAIALPGLNHARCQHIRAFSAYGDVPEPA